MIPHRRTGDSHRVAPWHARPGTAIRHGTHDRRSLVTRARHRRQTLALQLRHAGRGCEHTADAQRYLLAYREAIGAIGRCRRRTWPGRWPGHLGDAVGAASALRAIAGGTLRSRLDGQRSARARTGRARGRYRPRRRCGGGRPARALPRYHRGGSLRSATRRLERLGLAIQAYQKLRSPDRLARRTWPPQADAASRCGW